MATFRVNKTENYTVMSNVHLRERNMSLKAKGLLSLMLALPNNWDYSIDGLCKVCKENQSAIKSTLDELKTFGYLVVTKKMPNETKSGRIEYVYDIYEVPQVENTEKQDTSKQGIENQCLEIQGVENPAQLNKNKNTSYTKKIINNSLYKGEGNSKNPKEITDLFNSTCPSLPAVKYMTENRREAIAKALETFTVEQLQQCFQIAEESPFLTGKNERGWKATFDWLINPENVAKVLEDNFPSEAPANVNEQPPASFNTEEFFSAALDRAYSAK